jgi:acyl carrier protein
VSTDPRILKIFHSVFGEVEISRANNVDNIDSWDSLTHMDLILAIEKEFSVKLSFHEIAELTSVQNIIETLEKRGLL